MSSTSHETILTDGYFVQFKYNGVVLVTHVYISKDGEFEKFVFDLFKTANIFDFHISVAPTSFGVADTTARIVFRHPPEAIKAIELLDGKWFGESNIHGKNLSCKINGATDVTTNYDYCQPNQF